MTNYDRFLAEDEVEAYTSKESLSEKFETIYNTFVESDLKNFKAQINELNTNDFAKFVIHLIEMNVHPMEIARTLQSVVD